MKPARREAYFSCLEITVEHSVNFIELLCRAVFGPYGRYTNFEVTPGLIRIMNIGIRFGTVKIDQLANTTTSVELKLSDIFDTILCAISSVRTTIPGDKNASVMTDGTTVTIYLHNNTNSVGTMWIYYVIFGALR